MPTDVLVLDYAPPGPRAQFVAAFADRIWRGEVSAGRWCLHNRQHLLGVTGAFVATRIVTAAMDARVVLSTPVYGGCGAARGAAYEDLYLSGLSLWLLPIFWLAARRSWWASRVARTAAVVALVWWLYMRFPMHGPRLFL
jgi:hypothetical protein